MNKPIEIRTWPQRTNVVVLDVARATPIAEYPIKPQHAEGAVFNPLVPYEERARHAVQLLESDQTFLRQAFLVEDDDEIHLEVTPGSRTFIEQVLVKYGLVISDLDIQNSCELIKYLDRMPLQDLFSFLIDWYDVVERHRDFGSSGKDPDPWVQRARPDDCFLYHYLDGGLEARPEDPSPEAHGLMMLTLDVSDSDYTFGHLLRWVYFTRAEFQGIEREHLHAWRDLGSE